ncbi:MAG: hypothetical protein R3D66_01430 [Alphaproteobacteria bacterium]
MKKLAATVCILGTAMALSACETNGGMGNVDTAPPYASERTAGWSQDAAPAPVRQAPAQEERVFRQVQSK